MQIVSCPSCGAEVQFKSHAAVLAVCAYCHASLLKDADSVKDLGKMSAVLEDYTRLQIGSAGVAGGRHFTLVGRIQLRYEQGTWNEWYVLFDDASTAWLGDSSGLYTLTRERDVDGDGNGDGNGDGALPAFEQLKPGERYRIAGELFTASEVRSGECIAGQGELPFRVGEGWRIRVADLRRGAAFLTLDYTDGTVPAVYSGSAVTLDELKFQLLRDDEQIKASAGKYRGKLDALDCPSCGSAIKYLPGLATKLVCPACAAQLDAAGPQAQVLAAGEKVDSVRTTLPLGACAMIDGSSHTVIGAMIRADEEGTQWTEYLLYSTRAHFTWLVETDDGWSRANVMPAWPEWPSLSADSARVDAVDYHKLYDYDATVVFAAGAFNWRVAAGDVVHVFEFEHGSVTLSAELTAAELTWSRSTPVAYDQLKAWFGDALRGGASAAAAAGGAKSTTPVKFLWWLFGLNLVPLMFNFDTTLWYMIMAVLAIYLPGKYFTRGDKGGETKP